MFIHWTFYAKFTLEYGCGFREFNNIFLIGSHDKILSCSCCHHLGFRIYKKEDIVINNIYKVRSVLKYLSCWRSPSFIMEIHTLITAVWLDHYWRSYCFFTWIFHQTVYMFNLSCILNINSSNLCILTYCQLWNYYKAGVCLYVPQWWPTWISNRNIL
jgi:hypothetical protein